MRHSPGITRRVANLLNSEHSDMLRHVFQLPLALNGNLRCDGPIRFAILPWLRSSQSATKTVLSPPNLCAFSPLFEDKIMRRVKMRKTICLSSRGLLKLQTSGRHQNCTRRPQRVWDARASTTRRPIVMPRVE